MTHQKKVKLARKMQSKMESEMPGSGIFDSNAWLKRKEAIARRIANKQVKK